MRWLENKIYKWSISKQQREFDHWHDMLQAMNAEEIGAVVAMATNTRHHLEEKFGISLLDPIVTYATHPDLVLKLHGVIQLLQKENKQSQAASVMVWLFTLRCAGAGEMRSRGRRLWKTLQRGMPFVRDAAEGLASAGFVNDLDVREFDKFPIGLEPDPVG